MKRLKTLRVRFALWIAGLFLMVLIVFGLLVYFGMAQGLSASIDASLILNASQIGGAVDVADDGTLKLPESFAEEPENAYLREQGFTMRLFNPDGKPLEQFGLYRGLPVISDSIAAAHEHQSTFDTLADPFYNVPVRVYTAPIEDDNHVVGVIQVAQSLARVEDTLGRLLTTLLISVPLLVIVAGLSGYFLAARALGPIDQITRTAHSISVNDLSARLNFPVTDDEVGRLAETFDTMLVRLQKAFQHERQFTADAAHELRTPLSAMQAILGMIREKRRTPEEYEQALADLTEEADRLRTLTEALFLLSRSDMQQLSDEEAIDLSTLLCDVTDSLSPLAESKGLTLTCTVPHNLALIGDTDSLIRLFVNLLGNAIKYTERGNIDVRASQNPDGTVNVTISDTGIGIPGEHLPYIFDRFYRVDKSRTTEGAGLGLAIALDITRSHGGTIEVDSEVGLGTTFKVQLAPAH